jgi:hypothetical protein
MQRSNYQSSIFSEVQLLGSRTVDVQVRVDDQSPIKQVRKASMGGRAAFAPDAVAFIQSWPDNGKLSIRTRRSNDGKIKEASFNLGAVSELRNKVAKACDWGSGSVDDPVGSIDQQEKR